MERHSIGQAFIGAIFSLGLSCVAHGASFAVSSERVMLSASQPETAITVRNAGSEPTVVHLETAAWSQRAGVDVLGKTQDLLAIPTSFTIPPGGSQVVRVGLRDAPDPGAELTYRLFLQETLPAQKRAQNARAAQRVSLPVFVTPEGSVTPKLMWRATKREDGKIRLQASNLGGAHIHIAQVSISALYDNKAVGAQKLAAYVLPDNSRQWMMKTDSALPIGSMLRVLTQTDAGEIRTDIALESDSAIAPGEPVMADAGAH